MREIRPSSLEGGVRLIPHPYPYHPPSPALDIGMDFRLPESKVEPWAHCKLRRQLTRTGNPAPGSLWIPAPSRFSSPNTTGLACDFDGTLARDDAAGHFLPPYPLGEPIPEMIAMVKSLLAAGVTVKIFSARACEPESIPIIQAWVEKHGLGRLEVTNQKDYDLIRYYDDRAIQMVPKRGKSVGCLANGKPG